MNDIQWLIHTYTGELDVMTSNDNDRTTSSEIWNCYAIYATLNTRRGIPM